MDVGSMCIALIITKLPTAKANSIGAKLDAFMDPVQAKSLQEQL